MKNSMSYTTKAVYKYSLPISDNFSLAMPKGAEILTVQTQHNSPNLWALVDPTFDELEMRYFFSRGTGHPIDISENVKLNYIGTIQMLSNNFVWHLFEMKDKL